ncbi:MAG TPA: winged helix-turn-helix transcriptional regulator [Kofleriaceae bacterium]
MTDHVQPDGEMAAQFERVIRRVKQSMNYRGSYSTRDILGSLVARWVQSGEWERLKQLPSSERRIGESVRRFILDRLDQLRRRGDRSELDEEQIVLPDEVRLGEMIELAELRTWIEHRVGELERGEVDPRMRIPLASPKQVGQALRHHLAGLTQRQIASVLGISLGAVNKRIAEGTNYLIVLQGLERGIGAGS